MGSVFAHPFTREQAEALVATRPWWYHRFEIFPGVITPGVHDPEQTLAGLDFPTNLKGQRILEIGPAEGFYTKQLTMRGADVTALEYQDKDKVGFSIMEKLHGAPFNFVQANIYEIPRLGLKPFDLVLCLGVLYHLPDMVRALHLIRTMCTGRLIIETLIATDLGDQPLARYYQGASLNGDITNFWSPNIPCVESMLRDVGFELERVQMFSQQGDSGRAAFWCRSNTSVTSVHKTALAYVPARAG